jgi:hypothetical protein
LFGLKPGLAVPKSSAPGIGQRTLHDRLTKPTRPHPPVLAHFLRLPVAENQQTLSPDARKPIVQDTCPSLLLAQLENL